MTETTLVILAAGMGSRYGGLKQIDPVDAYQNLIIDFSIYDALRAGFQKIVFIIKQSIREEFEEVIGKRISRIAPTQYVYQELDKLPPPYTPPANREKPWGTGHALLCCRDVVTGPFAVINADDFYGYEAYDCMHRFLTAPRKQKEYAMVGYAAHNTLTDHGTVVRGVCQTNAQNKLVRVEETRGIHPHPLGSQYERNGETVVLSRDTLVSMNFWGFDEPLFEGLAAGFPSFLAQGIKEDPLKCEYLLPSVVQSLLENGEASVEVLKSGAKWFGVTYREDMPIVKEQVRLLKEAGAYPEKLWG
jgi:dTDP-glucose pyrophosphorylase